MDEFLDLTMRQVWCFLEKIRVRNTTNEYYRSALQCKIHGYEMPPLEDLLGVSFETSSFDSETDQEMEKIALKLLAERRAMHNV